MEALSKLEEQAIKLKKPEGPKAKEETKKMKKRPVCEEETDKDSPAEMESSDDDFNLEDESTDFREEEFIKCLTANIEKRRLDLSEISNKEII